TAPAQGAQPPAALHAPPAHHANTPQAHKPSALQTGCGSKPQHQGSSGSGRSDASQAASALPTQKSRPQSQPARPQEPPQITNTATPPAACAQIPQPRRDTPAQVAQIGPASRSPSAEIHPQLQSPKAPCNREAAHQHARATHQNPQNNPQ